MADNYEEQLWLPLDYTQPDYIPTYAEDADE